MYQYQLVSSPYLLVSCVTFGFLMTLTFLVINHVGDVILICFAILTFLKKRYQYMYKD